MPSLGFPRRAVSQISLRPVTCDARRSYHTWRPRYYVLSGYTSSVTWCVAPYSCRVSSNSITPTAMLLFTLGCGVVDLVEHMCAYSVTCLLLTLCLFPPRQPRRHLVGSGGLSSPLISACVAASTSIANLASVSLTIMRVALMSPPASRNAPQTWLRTPLGGVCLGIGSFFCFAAVRVAGPFFFPQLIVWQAVALSSLPSVLEVIVWRLHLDLGHL